MLYASETYVDIKRNCIIGDTEPYETYTDNVGELFRSLQREYGRCTSKVYRDKADGTAIAIGWVFEKNGVQTWVSVHERKPEKTVKYFYKEIGRL